MKILLSTQVRAVGGTSSFARKFKVEMEKHGHEVVLTRKYIRNYDVLVASPQASFRQLLHAKWNRKPIVQRLDGVYYPATAAGRWWRFHNLPLSTIRNYFANAVIYQSNYSRKVCEKFIVTDYGLQTTDYKIYNGVDINQFSPNGPAQELRDNPSQHVFITWSRFRRPDQIDPLLEAFEHYKVHIEPNSKLVVIGTFEGQAHRRKQRGVEYVGRVANHDIPRHARGADVFVMTHQNPPCPNNVLEAMSCGLPIAGIADGAMPELVTSGVEGVLLPVSGDGFDAFRAVDAQQLAQALHECIENRPAYGRAAVQRVRTDFTVESMTRRYLQVLAGPTSGERTSA